MKPLDAASSARSAVEVAALAAVLSGCYYYVPSGYAPYGEAPDGMAQQYPFTLPDAAASDAAPGATASTNTHVTPAAPVWACVLSGCLPCVLPRCVSPLRLASVAGTIRVVTLRLLERLLLRRRPPWLLGPRTSRLGRAGMVTGATATAAATTGAVRTQRPGSWVEALMTIVQSIFVFTRLTGQYYRLPSSGLPARVVTRFRSQESRSHRMYPLGKASSPDCR